MIKKIIEFPYFVFYTAGEPADYVLKEVVYEDEDDEVPF